MATYTKRQQKAHRKAWVKALRSGDYQQGKHVLRNANGAMCCLGVACEISGLATWSKSVVGEDNKGYAPVVDGAVLPRFYPPAAVLEWLGLADEKGKFGETDKHGLRDALSVKNDNNATFAEIADIIEAEPEGLVVK